MSKKKKKLKIIIDFFKKLNDDMKDLDPIMVEILNDNLRNLL